MTSKPIKTRTKAETYARYKRITADYVAGLSYKDICRKHGITPVIISHALIYCGQSTNRRRW